MSSYVVMDFPTIMDGYVVRWFADEDAANRHDPIISASRDGVVKHQLGPVADELEQTAREVHDQVRDWYDGGANGVRDDNRPWRHHLTHVQPLFRSAQPIRAPRPHRDMATREREVNGL